MGKAREFYLLSKDGKQGHWAYETEEAAIHSGGKTASESFGVSAYIKKSTYLEACELIDELEEAIQYYDSDIYEGYGIGQEPEVIQDGGQNAIDALNKIKEWRKGAQSE